MKKSQLLIFCSLVSSTCFAQFQKNDRLLSGQIHFNNGTNKNISNNAQATNWSTGINISSSRFYSGTRYNSINFSYTYSGNKQDNGVGGVNRFSGNQAGFSFGHTILSPLASKLYLSIPFTAGFSIGNARNKDNNVLVASSTTRAVGLSANMGLVYQTSKRWVFMANIISLGGLSYNHSRLKSYNNVSGQVVSEFRNNSLSFTGGFTGTPFNNLAIGAGYLVR